ncbi:hypothetical protein J8273_1778 [Carpediemonas membranifera]|uniref:Uncharacterized protein n=1 Tax=Carpediemonas membranifera TaxID=201153 RepID=A0A8J6EBB5_9EUKA|nr:hypothetical protein J8273_1778 [Carpediemonas membranifera]|eukprot:KAG9396760.1 hypothetical protein J8273_1778 [Carpediemonas membranifera]
MGQGKSKSGKVTKGQDITQAATAASVDPSFETLEQKMGITEVPEGSTVIYFVDEEQNVTPYLMDADSLQQYAESAGMTVESLQEQNIAIKNSLIEAYYSITPDVYEQYVKATATPQALTAAETEMEFRTLEETFGLEPTQDGMTIIYLNDGEGQVTPYALDDAGLAEYAGSNGVTVEDILEISRQTKEQILQQLYSIGVEEYEARVAAMGQTVEPEAVEPPPDPEPEPVPEPKAVQEPENESEQVVGQEAGPAPVQESVPDPCPAPAEDTAPDAVPVAPSSPSPAPSPRGRRARAPKREKAPEPKKEKKGNQPVAPVHEPESGQGTEPEPHPIVPLEEYLGVGPTPPGQTMLFCEDDGHVVSYCLDDDALAEFAANNGMTIDDTLSYSSMNRATLIKTVFGVTVQEYDTVFPGKSVPVITSPLALHADTGAESETEGSGHVSPAPLDMAELHATHDDIQRAESVTVLADRGSPATEPTPRVDHGMESPRTRLVRDDTVSTPIGIASQAALVPASVSNEFPSVVADAAVCGWAGAVHTTGGPLEDGQEVFVWDSAFRFDDETGISDTTWEDDKLVVQIDSHHRGTVSMGTEAYLSEGGFVQAVVKAEEFASRASEIFRDVVTATAGIFIEGADGQCVRFGIEREPFVDGTSFTVQHPHAAPLPVFRPPHPSQDRHDSNATHLHMGHYARPVALRITRLATVVVFSMTYSASRGPWRVYAYVDARELDHILDGPVRVGVFHTQHGADDVRDLSGLPRTKAALYPSPTARSDSNRAYCLRLWDFIVGDTPVQVLSEVVAAVMCRGLLTAPGPTVEELRDAVFANQSMSVRGRPQLDVQPNMLCRDCAERWYIEGLGQLAMGELGPDILVRSRHQGDSSLRVMTPLPYAHEHVLEAAFTLGGHVDTSSSTYMADFAEKHRSHLPIPRGSSVGVGMCGLHDALAVFGVSVDDLGKPTLTLTTPDGTQTLVPDIAVHTEMPVESPVCRFFPASLSDRRRFQTVTVALRLVRTFEHTRLLFAQPGDTWRVVGSIPTKLVPVPAEAQGGIVIRHGGVDDVALHLHGFATTGWGTPAAEQADVN